MRFGTGPPGVSVGGVPVGDAVMLAARVAVTVAVGVPVPVAAAETVRVAVSATNAMSGGKRHGVDDESEDN